MIYLTGDCHGDFQRFGKKRVSGNHENYNMIAEYPLEFWNGGKVRHIIKDKIILLERGQIFTIEGMSFFTFGGASSHYHENLCLDDKHVILYEDIIRLVDF